MKSPNHSGAAQWFQHVAAANRVEKKAKAPANDGVPRATMPADGDHQRVSHATICRERCSAPRYRDGAGRQHLVHRVACERNWKDQPDRSDAHHHKLCGWNGFGKCSEEDITSGPNGKLYFTEAGANAGVIGLIDPTQPSTQNNPPYTGTPGHMITAKSGPLGITVADGKLWFTQGLSGQIGMLDPNTGVDR